MSQKDQQRRLEVGGLDEEGRDRGEKSSLPGPAVQAQLVQAAVWDL